MRTLFFGVLFAAMATSAGAQSPRSGGTCRANQTGNILLTSAEYADGYKVEAPWRVVSMGRAANGGPTMTAELDHIIETNPATGKRHHTPLPGTVEMTFEGENNVLMLREAADVWCATVAKALGAQEATAQSRAAPNRVVM